MRYRYSLGKYYDETNNLAPNFAGGCGADWVCGAGWTLPGNAVHTGAVTSFLYADNVFEAGHEYGIQIVADANVDRQLWFYIGEWFYGSTVAAGTTTVSNIKNLSTNTRLTIAAIVVNAAGADAIVYSTRVWERFWNDPIEVEPGQWDDASLVIEESELVPGFITSYVGSLKFIKESYTYLESKASNFGTTEPLLIEFWNVLTDTWEELFEGTINIAEMLIDYKKKEVTTDIEEAGAGNFLRTQARDKFYNASAQQTITDLGYSITAAPAFTWGYDRVLLHRAIAGTDTIQIPVIHQYRGLRDLMVIRSRNTMVPVSTYLASALYVDGATPIWLGFLRGAQYYGDTAIVPNIAPELSFEDVLNNYNYLLNLVFWYAKDANDIPTFYIEDFATQVDRVPSITFNNVMLEPVQMSFDTEPKRINVGYGNTFDGQDELFYYVSDEPALATELNLLPTFSRDYRIFNDIRLGAGAPNSVQYAQNVLFLEYYDSGGGVWKSRQYGAANTYNATIRGDDYIDLWTAQLGTDYTSQTGGVPAAPLAAPLIRDVEITTLVTKAQFDTIRANPVEYIGFNGFSFESQGLVKRLRYPLKNTANGNAICRIKILAE